MEDGEKDLIDADELAELIADKLTQAHGCRLTSSEQEAVKDLIQTKRNAVRAFLWVCGALVLWIIKDIYIYIVNHMTFK